LAYQVKSRFGASAHRLTWKPRASLLAPQIIKVGELQLLQHVSPTESHPLFAYSITSLFLSSVVGSYLG
jgi:hypothetical protein